MALAQFQYALRPSVVDVAGGGHRLPSYGQIWRMAVDQVNLLRTNGFRATIPVENLLLIVDLFPAQDAGSNDERRAKTIEFSTFRYKVNRGKKSEPSESLSMVKQGSTEIMAFTRP